MTGTPGARVQRPDATRTSDTIRARFEALQRIYPKRSKLGGRYPVMRNAQSPKASDGATLYLYMHSSDDTYAVHETIFRYKTGRTARAWSSFFYHYVFNGWDPSGQAKSRDGLLRGVIIPAMNIRSNKQWDVISCIGYTMYALSRSDISKSHKRRNKAES
jgi:hypothetical protein